VYIKWQQKTPIYDEEEATVENEAGGRVQKVQNFESKCKYFKEMNEIK